MVQGAQRELLEKVEYVAEQVLDHENHMARLEKTVAGLKAGHDTLKLSGQSRGPVALQY